MTKRVAQQDVTARRLQLLASYRAWYEVFMREHTAAIARSRLLALRETEVNWTWLSL